MSDTAAPTQGFQFGRVFSTTFGLIGRNFIAFFLLALLFTGVPLGAISFFQYAVYTGAPWVPAGGMVWLPLLAALVSMLGSLVLQGALTKASIDDLSGKGASLGGALRVGFGSIFPLLGLGILVSLGVGLGLVLLVVPGLYLMVRWCVSAPVLVVEETSISGAMGRSGDLTEGNRWAIFGLVLIYIVIVFATEAVLGFVLMAIGMDESYQLSLPYLAATPFLQALQSLFATVGAAAIYFELRRVKEGVGIGELASVFD